MKISVNSTFSYIKFNVNYGSVLQCYALQKYLKKRGHNVTLLRDYRANPVPLLKRLKYVKTGSLFFKKLNCLAKLQKFIKKNISLSERGYISYKQLVDHCPSADCHIVGSDQIWHDAKNFRYLTYVPDDKLKLSYAASFGMSQINDQMKNAITPYLIRFKGIAVREDSGVKIINDMGYDAVHVLDPTLLLNYQEYPYVQNMKSKIGGKYIYGYFLNLNSREDIHYKSIKSYAEEKGIPIYFTVPLNYDLFSEDKGVLFPSVEEWLGLYHDAECIFTNTYHGLLFCIIFKKEFVFFYNSQSQGIERFTSILLRLGLEERMVSDDIDNKINTLLNEKINYDEVYRKIHEWRKVTDKYFESMSI